MQIDQSTSSKVLPAVQQQGDCCCGKILALMCVLVVIPFILDDRLVDGPAGVAQEEGHTGFLHLPSAVVIALISIARRIQPSLSPVDREVEFCVPANESFSNC